MNQKQQLELLRSGISKWNKWRQENTHIQPNFSGTDLSREDLGGANLSNANLKSVALRGANLVSTNLNGSNLSDAILSGANLRDANLGDSDLSGANLTGAAFRRTKLAGADVTNTVFLESLFINVDLSAVLNLEKASYRGPCPVDQRTLEKSWPLPITFLRGVGLPAKMIDYLPTALSPTIDFYSCFISYNKTDAVFARRLHTQLQDRGIRCWLDEHQMLPGDDIYEKIQQGIELWDKVLLCCSEKSLTSWWVDNEIDTAFEKERKLMRERGGKVFVLIPLDTDGYLFSDEWKSGKREQVKARIAGNFRGWQGDESVFDRELEKVVMALRTDATARRVAPEPKL